MEDLTLQIVEINGQRSEWLIHHENTGTCIYPDGKAVRVTWDREKGCFVLAEKEKTVHDE